MVAGEIYDPLDPELVAGRRAARAFLEEFNADLDEERRMARLAGVLAGFGEGSFVERPLCFDYGSNIAIGRDTFLNFGAVILDCAPVRIGDRVNVAPNVQLLTADHPREPELRAQGIEFSKPLAVGDDVWLGAGAILCPGVSVGDGAVIGAGSVVTRDVPARALAAGNPCRVLREP